MAKKTPENIVKDRVKDLFEAYEKMGVKLKLHWKAGAHYGVADLDAVGVIAGIPVALELKRFDGKGKTTKRQELDLKEYRAAGAVAMLIECEADFDHLRDFLKSRLIDPHVPAYRDWSRLPWEK